MARNRILYLGALIGALVFHMYYPLWLSWFLLLVAVGLPLLSLVLSIPLWTTAQVRLEGPGRVDLGENAKAQLRLTTKIPAGRCYARLEVPGKKRGRRIPLRGSMDLPLDTSHCTRTQIRVKSVKLLDYLGLFYLPHQTPAPIFVGIWPLAQAPEPMPDVTKLLSPPLRPKAGGGYSEVHELRDYRPGDPMRDVHWKLSAKADKLIVREAQEEVRRDVILTLSLHGVGDDADSSLGQLLYLSRWLLDQGIVHRVLCTCGEGGTVNARIISPEALDRLIGALLGRLPEITPSVGDSVPHSSQSAWLYAIRPQKKEDRP